MYNFGQLVLGFFNPTVSSITKEFTKQADKLEKLKTSLASKNRKHLSAAFNHQRKATDALLEYQKADRIRNRINQFIEKD